MILFAFAGNMDVEEFAKTVPSAKKIGMARLPGYNFIFNKTADDQSSKANILQSSDPNDAVWGVLIELDDKEKSNFFNAETFSSDFMLETVTCMDQHDKIHTAEAFVALPHAVNTHLLPYDWYQEKVVQLAKNAGLPDGYIYKISLMPVKIDPDEDRRTKRLNKIKK
jgi:hypothetical protein